MQTRATWAWSNQDMEGLEAFKRAGLRRGYCRARCTATSSFLEAACVSLAVVMRQDTLLLDYGLAITNRRHL